MNSRTVVPIAALASCLFGSTAGCRPSPAQTSSQPELLYTLDGGGAQTDSIAFSPRGDLLATGSEDRTAKIWDLATGRLRRTLGSTAQTVGSVVFSPDGSTLAAGDSDGTVKLWEVATGQPERELPGAHGPVAYSPNGRLLAAVDGNRVKLWDSHSWKVVTTLRGAHLPPSPLKTSVWIAQIAFSPDGKRLATVEEVYSGGEMNPPADFVQLWDTTTWKVRQSLHQPPGSQIQVAFSPDSRQLAVAGGWIYRCHVLLWNIDSRKTRPLISLDDVDMVSSIVYDPHGRWVAFATQAGARFVDVASAKQFLVVDVARSAFGPKQVYALSPDGRLLAAIREDGAVEIWRLPADLERASTAATANAPAATPRAGGPT